jgi:uncharacterized membrane protein
MGSAIVKIVCFLVTLLSLSLLGGLVAARGGSFAINPKGEAIETIQLTPPDSVFGNMTVSGGFVDFYITNPSNDVIYQNLRTPFDSFNFTADENGTYEMHFANNYQMQGIVLNLTYHVNFFVAVNLEIHISVFSTQTTTSNGVVITQTQPNSNVVLNINPPGFPAPWQFWQISVYSKNQSSSEGPYLMAAPNATVLIKIINGNQTTTYSTTTDEQGNLEFLFQPQYTDVSFQAFYEGNQSDIFGLTQQAKHYLSGDKVETVFSESIFTTGITGITGLSAILLHFTKKIRIFSSWLVGAVLCISSVQLLISIIAKSFWSTPWGYPENNLGLSAWTFMQYIGIVCIVLYVFWLLSALYFGLRNPNRAALLESIAHKQKLSLIYFFVNSFIPS